jgi:hypothetical protein
MRLLLLPAVTAALLVADQSASAQSSTGIGCVDNSFGFVSNGITNVEAHTHVGQACQIAFGRRGSIVTLQIPVRPTHGILGASEKEGNRRYVAYVPQKGFVGHDRFEVYLRYMDASRIYSFSTLVKVEMNVAP